MNWTFDCELAIVARLTAYRCQHPRSANQLSAFPRGRIKIAGSFLHHTLIDAPDIHFAIFFDQPMPGDIGYRASASAYARQVLAATFNMHIDDLPNFPFTNADPLIVSRNNPVDEHAMGE